MCFSGWDGGSHGTLAGRGVLLRRKWFMRLICFSSVKCPLFSCGCFVFVSGFVVTVLPYARLCFCTCACLYARLCSFFCTGIAPAHCACFSPIAMCCFRMPYGAYASQLSAFAVLLSYFLRPALSVVVIPGLTDFSLLIKSASLRGETYTHLFRPYFRPIRFIDSAGDDG